MKRYYVKFSAINPNYKYFYCEPAVPAGFHVIPSEGWDFTFIAVKPATPHPKLVQVFLP
ncbi:MAG: hypothetical protein IPN94_04965 [Sphingobacteriales bacterium]|nr:hypothetical protein [Sphingobacteriales bacterium]